MAPSLQPSFIIGKANTNNDQESAVLKYFYWQFSNSNTVLKDFFHNLGSLHIIYLIVECVCVWVGGQKSLPGGCFLYLDIWDAF